MKHQPTEHSLEEIEQLCSKVETVLQLIRNNVTTARESGLEALRITSFRNAEIGKDKLITFNQAVQRGIVNELTSGSSVEEARKDYRSSEKTQARKVVKKKAAKKKKN